MPDRQRKPWFTMTGSNYFPSGWRGWVVVLVLVAVVIAGAVLLFGVHIH
jgi:hypothetical protein